MAKSMSNICQGVQPFQTKSQPSTDNNNALQQQPHLSRENFIIYSHNSDRPWLRFRWQILKLVWRSSGRGLMNGWWYFGCQRAGTCVMWSPRVYPFIHCKGSIEGTRRIMAFTTPHRNTKLLAWYPAWQVPLGLHRILNLSMIKDRRWSYHTTRILWVHLPQLLGWEQNVDVPPLSVDTLVWTSTVVP